MNGEHRGRQPGSGRLKARQQSPQQQRIDEMQDHIDKVITSRIQPPQPAFHPERGIDQGPVMPFPELQVSGRKPDPPHSERIAQHFCVGHHPVVPDETAPEHGRRIADGSQQDQGQDPRQSPARHFPRAGVQGDMAMKFWQCASKRTITFCATLADGASCTARSPVKSLVLQH